MWGGGKGEETDGKKVSCDEFKNDYRINNHFVETSCQKNMDRNGGSFITGLADLFRDDVSMLVHELLLAHMLPRKIFNLLALERQYFNLYPTQHRFDT